MKTFLFAEKNSSAVLTLSAELYEEALDELILLVVNPEHWRVDDEDGEDEEELTQLT